MTVYLIHFERRYKHAGHYLGYSSDLVSRIRAHRLGQGARLLQVVNDAGIRWFVVRIWDGGYDLEHALKARRNAPQLCPVCNPRQQVEMMSGTLGMSEDVSSSLDAWAFKEWLFRQEPGEVVGLADEPLVCPLSCWLGVVYGGQWQVNASWYRWRAGDGAFWQDWQALPPWAMTFVSVLGERYGCAPVFASQALELLGWVLVDVGSQGARQALNNMVFEEVS